MKRYTKDDVQRSYHHGTQGLPMVNVKVYTTIAEAWKTFRAEEPDIDPRFTEDYVERLGDEYLDGLFWRVCEWRFEDLQSDAEEIFAHPAEARPVDRIKVYAAGRSGGWAVVSGLSDIEDWDAVDLAKWRRFEHFARDTADYVMVGVLESVYLNEFECWKAEQAEDAGLHREVMPA